jgi:4-hydroxy-3-polyprenylbenzoate decarboxylase
MRLIIGITGATGTIYGVRLLERLGASISSGSFRTDGMIIAPCSAKSLAGIAHGYGENLIHRAADVVLKERRKLVLAVREAPLSAIHLENMLTLARMGAMVMPPLPAFYNHPRTIDDIVDYTVARLLDQFGLEVSGTERWVGEMGVGTD